jgi:hypothetical protein
MRARRLAGIVAVALLCAGAACGCVSTSSLRHDVQAYLDALATGDASAALALSDEANPERWVEDGEVTRYLLTDKVFRGATERISDVTIEMAKVTSAPRPGVDAYAVVRFSLAGSTREATLYLQRDGEHWKVTRGLMGSVLVINSDDSANLPFDISGVDSAGARCGAGDCLPGMRYLLLPGVYHIEVRVGPPWRLAAFNTTATSQAVTILQGEDPGFRFDTERIHG